ncbi:MAG TPA: response regulator [Candidatus Hydrogenedentes bacterium]|nr:response regulator [Candidatus Hydrogenedentota bacterium]HPG68237.1 response regulator [Candidatus Hydrogenedentota bacterium]
MVQGDSSERAGEESWRILIVDDDHDFVDTLRDILDPYGYHLRAAHTVKKACETARAFPADVALLDVRLGRQSGLDLVRELRDIRPATLCVMMTAYAALDSAVEALQLGAYDYLRKPVSAVELVRTLERCFERIRLERGQLAAEEALRQSEERFRTVVSASKDAMIAIEQHGRISVFNAAAEAMFGRTRDEMLGENTWFPLLPEDRREQVRQYIREYLDPQGPSDRPGRTFQTTAVHSDGASFPVEFSLSPGEHCEGRFVLVVVRDLTERTRLEDRLHQAQKMEAIGQLAGGVAHDFNNLLQAILCNIQFAMGDLQPEDRPYQDLQEALEAGQRAAALTEQLLAFSRRQILKPKEVNLNELIAHLMKMIRRVIGEHIELQIVPAPDLALVKADPGRIEQVLTNLFVNARDAMPRGGRITIETENVTLEEPTYEHPALARPGRYVMFRVTDTGCGMDEKTRAHIFEPFFTTKGVGKGTGLGLATVYGIVRQHNGFIQASTDIGKGTAFRIYLPALDRTVVAETPKETIDPKGGNETILIAEDDKPVRNVASRILKQAGYHVLTAADGEEAVRLFEKHSQAIDLILLDVVMPKLNGPQVHERVKTLRPAARVLFTSGYSLSAMAASTVVDEGPRLLQKPYEPDELLAAVRDALDT